MNVTELARQLKTTREELLGKLPELGFDIGAKAIKIDPLLAERIKQAWAGRARQDRLLEKMSQRQEISGSDGQVKLEASRLPISARITVVELAEKLGVNVSRLIGYLMNNGIMASLSQQIDFETAAIVAQDYGFKAVPAEQAPAKEEDEAQDWRVHKEELRRREGARPKPPIVVVMGHVDHGKTTLLDAIRKTNVVAGEAGGITQHIGAYQVQEKGKLITFLDTPGHEAFKTMRRRGGAVADMAILVVAADDGLQPQTLESINVIQEEKLPFVVAINKIDKPGADLNKVKKELSEINLASEDWGGKAICVPVSAKKGENIHELLEMVLLVAELEKFSAPAGGPAAGVIIESHISSGEGPAATVIVNAGVLRVGDEVVIGETYGKIKSLRDWRGEAVKSAGPATPVKILGLKSAPGVGEILRVQTAGRGLRKKKAKDYRFGEGAESIIKGEGGEENAPEKDKLKILVKSDVLGSLEAVITAAKRLESADAQLEIVKQGLGNITESDIALAQSAGAVIYGFNVLASSEVRATVWRSRVPVKTYKIIYELLDDVKARLKELVKTKIVEIPQGELEVLKVFKDSRAESIVGGRVKKAKIKAPAKFRLLRAGAPLDEGRLVELQINKRPVGEAPEGTECGVKVSGVKGFKEGDILSFYVEEERKENN